MAKENIVGIYSSEDSEVTMSVLADWLNGMMILHKKRPLRFAPSYSSKFEEDGVVALIGEATKEEIEEYHTSFMTEHLAVHLDDDDNDSE